MSADAKDESAAHELVHLVFGLVASSPNGQLADAFDDLAAWMRDHTEVSFELRVAPTYKELTASVREGSSDVAWLPPVAYAWLVEAVTPIGSVVRDGNTRYSSALLVRADGEVSALEQLQGKRAGWVDPWSAAGYVVPRIELARAGLDSATAFAAERFFGTHRDVLVALGNGECDVIATYARLVADEEAEDVEHVVDGPWLSAEGAPDVRVLGTFGPIPPDVLAARRNLAPAQYEKVAAAFRAVCSDPTGRALMQGVFGGEQIEEGGDLGHATLRIAYESAMARGIFD